MRAQLGYGYEPTIKSRALLVRYAAGRPDHRRLVHRAVPAPVYRPGLLGFGFHQQVRRSETEKVYGTQAEAAKPGRGRPWPRQASTEYQLCL